MKRPLEILVLVSLFLVSFVYFLYVTFPYEVVKESVSAEVTKATGYALRIGSLGPKFPIGVEAENVRIEPPDGGRPLQFDEVQASVGVFSLLLGRLQIEVGLEQGGGHLDTELDLPLMGLFDGNLMPDTISLVAEQFPIDNLAAFGIAEATAGDPMAGPLLSKIGVSGRLNGKLDLALDASNPTQSEGEVTLKLDQATLILSDPSLGLTDQVFKRALIQAKVQAGKLVVDKTSGFQSDELTLDMSGQVELKNRIDRSLLDLSIQFKMEKGLQEKFGFVIGMIVGDPTRDSGMTLQLRGPMGAPQITTL